jgi:DnaJ-class molecular chaperone
MIEKQQYLFQVDADTTKEDITKQYKRMAVDAHPDTGGSEDQFKQLSNRYNLYINHLEPIKEFYDMFTHSRASLIKMVGFGLHLISMNPAFSFLSDMVGAMITLKISRLDETHLLEMYIKYIETKKN